MTFRDEEIDAAAKELGCETDELRVALGVGFAWVELQEATDIQKAAATKLQAVMGVSPKQTGPELTK